MLVASTDAVPPRDRAAFWSEVVSRHIMDCDVAQIGGQPVSSEMRGETIGELRLAEFEGKNMRGRRTRVHIARSPIPYSFVGIQTAGTNCCRFRGQDLLESLGDIAIFDTVHPFEIDCARPFRQLVIRLPKPLGRCPGGAARPDPGHDAAV
jgi:hypothetical protein